MQRTQGTGRSARRIVGVLAAMALLVSACSTELVWEEATSASGRYTAEFPGSPETTDDPVPGSDLSLQTTIVEVGDDAYAISEVELPPGTPFDLDGAVEGAIDSGLAGLEAELGGSGTATETSRSTGDFEGSETREFTADLVVDDISVTYTGLTFVQDDVLVQVVILDTGGDNTEDVERFLSSFSSV